MAVRVGINGFGRIGRNIMRAAMGNPGVDFVAVNDLTDAATLAHLLKYDSVRGNLAAEVKPSTDGITVDGDAFKVLSVRDPAQLPWKDLGVGVMQLTYNTQNLVGSGCLESRDAGLSDFGRDVIDEMNRIGILIDLSHVGAQTSEDAIRHSKRPVAYTHCCPSALLDHPRNKSDEQLKLIVDHGGIIGIATYPPFLPKGGRRG